MYNILGSYRASAVLSRTTIQKQFRNIPPPLSLYSFQPNLPSFSISFPPYPPPLFISSPSLPPFLFSYRESIFQHWVGRFSFNLFPSMIKFHLFHGNFSQNFPLCVQIRTASYLDVSASLLPNFTLTCYTFWIFFFLSIKVVRKTAFKS